MEWLYRKCVEWAGHKHSFWVLMAISFGNSSVFPVTPYIPLVPMCYARPEMWLWYGLGSSLACVLGGVVGWLIGAVFWDAAAPFAYAWIPGLTPAVIESLRPEAGAGLFVAIAALAVSPVPYKVVAIAAGVFQVPLPLFLIASFVGRAPRMVATAAVVSYGSARCRAFIERHLVAIAIASAVVTVLSWMYGLPLLRALTGKSGGEKAAAAQSVAPAALPASTNGGAPPPQDYPTSR
ncbi:hypothetical protein DB346_24855 [Verrucomicrobia bacterium LW23]|nr:hypothetical protein DB346_24855 [Verrucomicrobia bacterium LW23]